MNAEAAMGEDFPRWALMWVLAGGLFIAGKVAVLRGANLLGWRRLAFVFAWIGMDPQPFADRPKTQVEVKLRWSDAFINMGLGAVLVWGVARHFTHPVVAGWVGMVGLIFMLHFGIFGLLAVLWNRAGVNVVPIMRCPVRATSLAEFWGRRWNLAFRDVAHRVFFKPVAKHWGNTAALWGAFAMSGLAHELVISVPAGGGFGMPTLYFLIQALGMTLERRGVTQASWLRTHAFTALPACILFHPPFVERVMVPFFRFIGALP